MRTLLRVPRSRGTRSYLALLLLVAVGLLLVAVGHWRRGIVLVGLAFLAAAGLRAVMPDEHVGLLAVRGRGFDIVWTLFLGASLIVLGVAVPGGAEG